MPLSSHEVLSNQLRTNLYINLSVTKVLTNKQTNKQIVSMCNKEFSLATALAQLNLMVKKNKKINKVINE